MDSIKSFFKNIVDDDKKKKSNPDEKVENANSTDEGSKSVVAEEASVLPAPAQEVSNADKDAQRRDNPTSDKSDTKAKESNINNGQSQSSASANPFGRLLSSLASKSNPFAPESSSSSTVNVENGNSVSSDVLTAVDGHEKISGSLTPRSASPSASSTNAIEQSSNNRSSTKRTAPQPPDSGSKTKSELPDSSVRPVPVRGIPDITLSSVSPLNTPSESAVASAPMSPKARNSSSEPIAPDTLITQKRRNSPSEQTTAGSMSPKSRSSSSEKTDSLVPMSPKPRIKSSQPSAPDTSINPKPRSPLSEQSVVPASMPPKPRSSSSEKPDAVVPMLPKPRTTPSQPNALGTSINPKQRSSPSEQSAVFVSMSPKARNSSSEQTVTFAPIAPKPRTGQSEEQLTALAKPLPHAASVTLLTPVTTRRLPRTVIMEGRSEEKYLRAIWNNLGVGRNGFLTPPELARVCEHIGMDDMSPNDLNRLYENLDVDGDGFVSFNEFMRGLFRHTPVTSSHDNDSNVVAASSFLTGSAPAPGRPSPTRAGRSRSAAGSTPAHVQSNMLFSQIDVNGTGFAHGADIIRLWESLGLLNGVDVLRHLQFDPNDRISLAELSYVLDGELTAEDNSISQDAVLQALFLSYKSEVLYCKNHIENLGHEKEKLRSDLIEEKNRLSELIREGDEGMRATENSRYRELANAERRYQDQIKTLKTELDYERDNFQSQLIKQRKSMENVIITLKEEESRLKDRMVFVNQEMGRLESELMDAHEKFAESEKLIVKQQRELDAVADLHRKMAQEIKELRNNRVGHLNQDERLENRNLKHQLELEIDQLRKAHDLGEDYRNKIEELQVTNERLLDQSRLALEQETLTKSTVSAADRVQNEYYPSNDTRYNESLLQNAVERLTRDNQRLELDCLQIRKRANELDAELKFKSKEVDALMEANAKLTDVLDKSAKNLEKEMIYCDIKQSEIDSLKKSLEKCSVNEEHLKSIMSKTQSNLDGLSAEFHECQNKLSESKKIRDTLEKSTADLLLKVDAAEKDKEKLQEANHTMSLALEQQKRNLDYKMKDVDSLHQNNQQLKFEHDALKQKHQNVESTLVSVEQKLEEIKFNNSELRKDVESLQQQNDDLKRQAVDLERLYQTKGKDVDTFKTNNEMLSQSIAQQSKNYELMASDLDERKKELSHAQAHIEKLLGEKVEEEKRWNEKNKNTYREALELKRERDLLTKQNQNLEHQLEKLNDKIRDLEHDNTMKKESISSLSIKMTSLDQNQLEKANEINELQEKLGKLTEALNKIERARDELYREKIDLETENDQLQSELKNGKKNLELVEKSKDYVVREFENFRKTTNKELESLKQLNDTLSQTLNKSSANLEQKSQECVAKRKEWLEMKEQRDALQLDYDRLEHQIKKISADSERKVYDLNKIKNESVHLDNVKHDLERLYREMEQKLHSKNKEWNELKLKYDFVCNDRNEVESNHEVQKQQIKDLEGQIINLNIENDAAQRITHELNANISELEVQKVKLENSLEELQKVHQLEKRRLNSALDDVKNLQIRLENRAAEFADKEKTINNLIKENKDLLRNAKEKSNDVTHLQAANDRLMEAVDQSVRNLESEMKNHLDHTEEIEKLKDENSTTQRLNRDLNLKLKEAESKQLQTDKEFSDIKMAKLELENRVNDLKSELLFMRKERVDREQFNIAVQKLSDSEKKSSQLEQMLQTRSTDRNRLLLESQDDFRRSLENEKRAREDVQRKYDRTRALLTEQTEKLKRQLMKTTKSDLLVKELYSENANLMKSLQVSEERENATKQRCVALEEQNRHLLLRGGVSEGNGAVTHLAKS